MTEKAYKPKRMTREQIKQGLESVPMDTIILGTNSGTRLTHKQREFARMVALGESKAGAYRKAYNSKGNSKTAAANGYNLSRNTDIQQMTEAFAQAKRFTDSHTPEQMRAFVIQQLTMHAQNEDFPPAQRLKALELIGKHSGVDSFVNRSEVVHIKQSGDIRERIMAKLQLIGASSTALVNNEQDDAQDADSLLSELQPPTPDENGQEDTHDTPTPPESGVELSDDTHTIPYNRISADPMSSDKSDMDVVFDATVTHSSVVDGVYTDSTQSEPSSEDDSRASHLENSR